MNPRRLRVVAIRIVKIVILVDFDMFTLSSLFAFVVEFESSSSSWLVCVLMVEDLSSMDSFRGFEQVYPP